MKNKNFYLFVALVLVLIVTYSNHFYNGFHFDDSHTIIDNAYIRDISNIPQFFTRPEMNSASPSHWGLRPLVTTSTAFDFWLGGGYNPFYFHLSMFIVYIFLIGLIYQMYKKVFGYTNPSVAPMLTIFTTALYALHTVNAETINYIIARSDILSTSFIVAAFVFYVYYPKLRTYYIYVVIAVVGALAKETVFVLPILLFFYVLLFEKDRSITDIFKKKYFKEHVFLVLSLLPLFFALGALQLYTLSKAPGLQENIPHAFVPYWLTQTYVWVHYIITYFLPFNLSADTDWSVIANPFDNRIIIGIIVLILLIVTIIKTSQTRKHKAISFGLIWFAIALLPTSLVPLAEVMNDHRMFFPYIGLTIAVVSYVHNLFLKYESSLKKPKHLGLIKISLALIILAAFAFGTYQRNKVWKNSETLWYDVTIKSPKNGRGLMNYGLVLMARGDYEEALSYFNKALLYAPFYPHLHVNLGIVKNALGRAQEAEQHYINAIQYNPNYQGAYAYYASFLKQHNRFTEARSMAEKAYDLNPGLLTNIYTLMEIYNELALWDELALLTEKTLSVFKHDATVHFYHERSMIRKSKLDIALDLVATAPTVDNFLSLSVLYYQKGDYENCIFYCLEVMKIDSLNADAYNNICASYNALRMPEKAVPACKKAIALKPDYTLAKNNLNYALSLLNE